ncbi:MAG: D-alanyl-D-alanine carboxypeptidase/D-alanyl-D-alanine-endopeptidase [Planctomycetota bacterium]
MNEIRSQSFPASRSSQNPARAFFIVLVFSAGWLASPFVASAQDGGFHSALSNFFAKLPDPHATAGACIVDLESGKIVFEHHADAPMVPASTMKVFVMAAALVYLGPEFVFDTVLASNGKDLIVLGDGDPGFGDEKIQNTRGQSVTSDFKRWAASLRQRGFPSIPGDLLIDESIFDEQRLHPTWEKSDLDNWYAAPVSGLSINGNCVDITVSPGGRHTSCQVSVQPPNSLVRIVNQCRSGGKGEPVLNHKAESFDYVVSGSCSRPYPLGSASFPDPGLLFADSLRTVLKAEGITISGEIRRHRVRNTDGTLPMGLTIIDRRKTSLADVLPRIGKDSQNLFAECLLKRSGFAFAHTLGDQQPQGTWDTGRAAIHATMAKAGVSDSALIVADGSGLSRDNRCTARQLASILAWVDRGPDAKMFRDSLSIAGKDGSLRKRMHDVHGRVVAKTGTIRGVRSLAGYVDAINGRRYAFAILFNGFKGSTAPYKEIQERVCRVLVGTSQAHPARTKTARR